MFTVTRAKYPTRIICGLMLCVTLAAPLVWREIYLYASRWCMIHVAARYSAGSNGLFYPKADVGPVITLDTLRWLIRHEACVYTTVVVVLCYLSLYAAAAGTIWLFRKYSTIPIAPA